MTGPHVQVIASGAWVDGVATTSADRVICADGGLAVALAAGRTIDVVVGDLDSASERDVAIAREAGARIRRHRADKDESDLELALAEAVNEGAGRVTVHLDDGGRLDHQLANLMVLASPRWEAVDVAALVGEVRVWVVRGHLELTVDPPLEVGDAVALQAVGGPATVTTSGLVYPLRDEELAPTEARGIANAVESVPVSVTVGGGVVLVMATGRQSAQAT